MIFTVVLIAIVVLPAVILTLLKTNATVTFLSLCTGYVLLRFISGDAILVASAISKTDVAVNIVQISVMLFPALLSALVLRGSVSGPKLLTNLIPALAFGLLGALLIVPLLPGGVQHNIIQTEVWSVLDRAKSLVAGSGILLSLMTLWLGSKPHKEHGKKKHH